MNLDHFIEELEKELEVGNALSTETPGIFLLPLEEDLTIHIAALPQGYTLSCNVGAVPIAKKESFFTDMLLANLFGQGTENSVLGLNDDGNVLTLSRTVDYTVQYKDFKESIEDFINVVDYWKNAALNYK